MARTIQIKRGLKADMPTLADGEFALTTDEEKVYIGLGGVPKEVGRVPGADEILPSADAAKLSEPFYLSNILTETYQGTEVEGFGFVSDPETYIMARAGGQSSGAWAAPYLISISGKGTKSTYSENPILGLDHLRIGCYDNYFNLINPDLVNLIKARSRWMLNDDGLPTPSIDYVYQCPSRSIDFRSQAFSHDESLFIPCSIQGKAGIRFSMQATKTGQTATHYVSTGHPLGDIHIIITGITNSPSKMVFAAYPCNNWYIDASYQDVSGADFSNTGSPTTGDTICQGLAFAQAGWTAVDMCFLMAMPESTMSDADIQTKVVADLLNWEARKASSISYWNTFWSGYKQRWDAINEQIRSKGLIALHQLAANSYKGGICSGIPFWNGVWIRDACWAMRNVGSISPSFARQFINWWVNASSIKDQNSYPVDGVSNVGSVNNTDNHAVFLLCMGCLWDQLKETETFYPLLSQLQDALIYVKAYFVSTDKHVIAHHPHDYWDEYETYGSDIYEQIATVKYESAIDVFWAKALSAIAPCFLALGDIENYAFCVSTSEALMEGIEDYREPNGSLYYAIKQDDSIFDSVVASPGTLYAAHLLDDLQCRKALQDTKLISRLGILHFFPDNVICFSNVRSGATKTKYYNAWGPQVPLVAAEMYKINNLSLIEPLQNSFPFGSWPESVKVHSTDSNRLIFDSLAQNFIWSLGEFVTLCEVMAGRI